MTGGLRKLRPAAGALCALAAAGSLAACGSGGDDSIAPGAIAEAATTTGSVKGADVTLRATMKSPALGDKALGFTGTGFQNMRSQAGHYTMDMSQLAQASGASGLDPSKLKMEFIYVNRSMFMRSPLFEGKLPHGKTWMGIDLRKALQAKGVDPSVMSQQSNPTEYLRYLKATSGKVTKVGSESVRGTRTTHYKATVDLTKAPGVDAASAKRIVALSGTSKMPIEVWIDGQHLIRRMRIKFDMKPQQGGAAGQKISLDETVDRFNFGPKNPVKPPPAADVFDATGLAAQGQGG
jgi:hypothetical protein